MVKATSLPPSSTVPVMLTRPVPSVALVLIVVVPPSVTPPKLTASFVVLMSPFNVTVPLVVSVTPPLNANVSPPFPRFKVPSF